MSSLSRIQRQNIAWLIPGPGPDERLGSVVDRAARLYGTTSGNLLHELIGDREGACIDIDGAGTNVILRIARAIQVSPIDLWRHRLFDHPGLLSPGSRLAFCPMCWSEDQAAGREPGLRRDWARALRTMCSKHREPLRLPRPSMSGLERAAFSRSDADSNEAEALACLAAIDDFGCSLDGALFHRQPWPVGWKVSPLVARELLCWLCFNAGSEEDFAPVCRLVCPDKALARYVRVPSHPVPPLRGQPWEKFRSIADPSLRRAALWVVGWWACPEWRNEWRPGWVEREVPRRCCQAGTRKSAKRVVFCV